MPAGYSARCKVCNSGRRTEIEKWIQDEGLSYRDAASRLNELGENISYVSIRNHCNEHFDVKAEAREQYKKSQAQMEEQVKKKLSDWEILDDIIVGNYELHQGARAWLMELVAEGSKIPPVLVQLLSSTASEIRQHIKQKQGEGLSVNVANQGPLQIVFADPETLEKKGVQPGPGDEKTLELLEGGREA